MKTAQYSDAQIMGILKQAEGGTPVSELCREHGMSNASFYKWRAKFGGMDASLITEMKDMAEQNRRLNIQGALDLETFLFTFVESEKINAQTTQQMLEKLEAKNPTMTAIHVFLDNARYHHAKILQPWLERSERQVKLHFLPPYAPHLNPIERLWGVMHKCVTHNRHYATFDQFTEAILGFFRKTLPLKWRAFTNTVTDNFRIISLDEYKVI